MYLIFKYVELFTVFQYFYFCLFFEPKYISPEVIWLRNSLEMGHFTLKTIITAFPVLRIKKTFRFYVTNAVFSGCK